MSRTEYSLRYEFVFKFLLKQAFAFVREDCNGMPYWNQHPESMLEDAQRLAMSGASLFRDINVLHWFSTGDSPGKQRNPIVADTHH
jgi:hypothetical protein